LQQKKEGREHRSHMLPLEIVQDVCGLDVPVDVATGVDVPQPNEQPTHVLSDVLWRECATLYCTSKIIMLKVLHDD